MIDFSRNNEFCDFTSTERECQCECYKKDKLAIYNLYTAMTMLKEDYFQLNRGGDMLAWYYYSILDRDASETSTRLKISPRSGIAEEFLGFEREILEDISGKKAHMGISDFISVMAQPSFIWREKYEFPRLYSWNDTAKNEIFSFFNYLQNATFRGEIELKETDFETDFSLPTLCSEKRNLFSGYCDLAENLPDLDVIMHLMHLAEYPLDFNENIKNLFK